MLQSIESKCRQNGEDFFVSARRVGDAMEVNGTKFTGQVEVATVEPEALIEVGFAPEEAMAVTVFQPIGCEACNDTGYKGRIALYEVMQVTPKVRDMVVNGATNAELRATARSEGMITLRESGLVKIWQGITSVDEVLKETTL